MKEIALDHAPRRYMDLKIKIKINDMATKPSYKERN